MKKLIMGVLAGLIATMALATSALASTHHPTGEFTPFGECPFARATITDCVYSLTTGGAVTIGNKTVPIVNPVTLQGGFEGTNPNVEFYGAENGETLSKTPQPVPGGLLGLLNCKTQTNLIIKGLCEAALENGLTGVDAIVELVGPSKGLTNIKLNTEDLIFQEGTALQMPIKIRLKNPTLGNECYIGSDKAPMVIPFTTGTSGALTGAAGELTFNENFSILSVEGAKLVNNTFAAPEAHGCGGLLSILVNPVVNLMLGTPAGEGKNSATLVSGLKDARPKYVIASE